MKIWQIICTVALLVLSACDNDNKEQLDGDWEDSIKLSTKEVTLQSDASEYTVTTKGEWWLENVHNLNTDEYLASTVRGGTEFTGSLGTYEWLTLTKPTAKSLVITAQPNKGEIRKLRICVSCGDYFDYITVTQKGTE